MLATLILEALRFAPTAIQAGIDIKNMIDQVNGKAAQPSPALPPVAVYAANVLSTLPNVYTAATAAYDILKEANARVAQMVREGRDPTKDEWDDINARIAKVLEAINK